MLANASGFIVFEVEKKYPFLGVLIPVKYSKFYEFLQL